MHLAFCLANGLLVTLKNKMTFNDLIEKLKREEETILLEILDINSNDLVDQLEGYIYDNQDRVRQYYDEDSAELDGEEVSD